MNSISQISPLSDRRATSVLRLLGVRCFPNEELLASELSGTLALLIREAVSKRGVCRMVFPGGRSPLRTIQLLTKLDVPWSALHLYPSDERCVPRDTQERNDYAVSRLLVEPGFLPRANLHSIPAEKGPILGASLYCEELGHFDCFDVVLLGLGPDGHTASLFPGHSALDETTLATPVLGAPKLPPERVTLGATALGSGRRRLVIAAGVEKAEAVKRAALGHDLPVLRVRPTDWYLDQLSASRLGEACESLDCSHIGDSL